MFYSIASLLDYGGRRWAGRQIQSEAASRTARFTRRGRRRILRRRQPPDRPSPRRGREAPTPSALDDQPLQRPAQTPRVARLLQADERRHQVVRRQVRVGRPRRVQKIVSLRRLVRRQQRVPRRTRSAISTGAVHRRRPLSRTTAAPAAAPRARGARRRRRAAGRAAPCRRAGAPPSPGRRRPGTRGAARGRASGHRGSGRATRGLRGAAADRCRVAQQGVELGPEQQPDAGRVQARQNQGVAIKAGCAVP